MNKQYKIIWSKVKHCYVVVSELAKNNGKAASTHIQSGRTLGVALSVLALCAGLSGVAQAADTTPMFSTVQGENSKVEASPEILGPVLGTKIPTQGVMSSIYGAYNTIDANGPGIYDGVANAIVGVVNRTENANAALIFGAGNVITNSYQDVNEQMLQTGDFAGAVKDSGGQVLVIGGANSVDFGKYSSVTGVSNVIKGKDASDTSDYNFVSGARNTITTTDHAYVIGTDNEVTNSTGNTVIGDNRTLTGVTNSVILGSGLDTTNRLGVTNVSNVVVAGYNANATVVDGVAIGSNSVASVAAGVAGYDPKTKKATTQETSIWKSTLGAVSVGASIANGGATRTRQITGVAAGVQDTDAVNIAQLKALQNIFDNEVAVKRDAITETLYSVNTTKPNGSNTVALGKGITVTANNAVAIGNGAWIRDSSGHPGSGDIAIGNNAKIDNYIDQSAGIAIGQNAFSENMAGGQERTFAFGQTTFEGVSPADPSKLNTGVAIGENAYARSGSTMIGTHKYNGKIGDVSINVTTGAEVRDQTGKNVNATTIGSNSYNSGAFSTIIGAYSIASGSYQGNGDFMLAAKNFGASIVGSLNSIESATADYTSGVANSIVGFANRTNNANGALVFGAGNEITNSKGNLSMPTLSMPESAKALQDTFMDSVKKSDSGGATLAIGGGNKADYTKASAIIGVNNKLIGNSSNVSQNNLVTGYKNTVDTADYVTVTGSNNDISNTNHTILLGDNRTITGSDNSIILGVANKASNLRAVSATTITTSADNVVVMGYNANAIVNDGVALGSNSVANIDKGVTGFDPATGVASISGEAKWKSTLGAVSVGDVVNNYTRQITGVAAGSADTDAVNVAQLKQVQSGVGAHYYSVNDVDGLPAIKAFGNYNNDGATGILSMAVGIGSSVRGGIDNGSMASVFGSLNTIDATGTKANSGVANAIVGVGNTTQRSNATSIIGAGNMVVDSYTNMLGEISDFDVTKPETITSAIGKQVVESGGQVFILGNANRVQYSRNTEIIGTANEVIGNENQEYNSNFIAGNENTVSNGNNTTIIGKNNSITTGESNIILANNRSVSNASNNVLIGTTAMGPNRSTTNSNVTAVGHETNSTVDYGVALGANSVANVEKEIAGYSPLTGMSSTEKDATWKSTLGAVSVGASVADGVATATRQITGVAAGTQDTDAVNVAQLKAAKVTVQGGTNIASVESTATLDGGTVYTVNAKDTYVTSATLSDGTLTINQNEGSPITVTGLATTSDVENSKVHYYSTKSDKKADGSNFANDGAKANDSIVIGINSSNSQDAVNSIVLGNGTTLEGSKNGTNGKVNGSVVVANGATINGIYNSVLATDYNNSPSGVAIPTTVKGQHNTVIGAGNTVSGDQGVTIGTLNNVIAAYAIGQNNTVKSKGLAFGSNNTVGQTSEDGGIAIGRNLTVEGYEGVAIGGETQALADYSIAIGSGIRASEPSTVVEKAATQGIALGYGAKAKVSGGIALGAGSQATTAAKVKGYDPSTDAQSTNTTGVWQSGKGALSIGTPNNTRQITGVAAGWQNTDAVNVAQLKAAKVSLVGGENVSISTASTPENGTTYTINAVDTDTTITKGEITYNGSAGKLVLTDSNDKTLEITGLRDLDTTGVTLNGDTLTFTRNDGTTYTVGGLATASDVAANKIHYYSVNAPKDPTKPGGNYNNDGAKGDNALAAGVDASAVAHNSIAIGNKAYTGASGNGSIALGDEAKVENYANRSGGIAIGQKAHVENMAGTQESLFSLGQTNIATGIAIGKDTYARTGSLMIGTHEYKGKLGDVEVDSSNTKGTGININATTIGTNSYNSGAFATVTGAYSIVSSNYNGGFWDSANAAKNFGATVVGSLNSIESATANSYYSGIANSVVGVANRTFNSNGSLIFGAGNEITNSYTAINAPSSGGESAKALQDTLMKAVQSSNSGGATLAIGGGNKADYTRASSIIGVNNTLTGTANDISEYNSIMGYKNIAENVSNVTVAGINNTIANTTSAVVLGDNHKVTGANNSIVIGSADKETELTATDATVIGHNANTSISTAVALGSGSVAAVDKGVLGYIPTGKTLTDADKATPTWTSTLGAVSVGVVGADGKATQTRQITGVAAGKADTDAVNVAQLQAVAAIAENAGTAAGKHTVVSVNGGDTAKDTTYVGDDGNLKINVKSKDGQNTYDIKLSDKLTIGTKGEPGKDGEDGQPGTPGKAGTPGSITIIGQNGKDADGKDLPEGNNTSANISVKDGANGLDGKDGVTRIVYTDEGGKEHEVATMDDGLNFTGDTANVTISKKLNETLSITGGIKEESKLSDNNIGVVAQENGGLIVKLAKDLTGLTSANIGGIIINNGGINMGDKQITNVKSGLVEGDNINNTNVANISDVLQLVNKQVEAAKVTAGDNISVENNKVSLKEDIKLGKDEAKQVEIKGSDGTITAGSGANQVAIDGKDASVTAGAGENQVALDGKNGQVTIGNAGNQIIMGNQEVNPINKDGDQLKENGQFITGLDNTTWEPDTKGYVPDRAATEGQLKDIADKINNIDTAVKDSSRVFAGDDGAKVTVKNGDTLHLNGGADATKLSDGNIGVVARKDAQGKTTDILDIKLSKDLTGLNSVTTENLTVNKGANIGDVSIAGDTITVGKGDSQTIINNSSVTTGNTTINNDGLTVKGPEASKDITIQNNNVNMGGNQIKNVGDAKETTDAVNKGQLDNAVNTITNGMGQMSNRISKLDRRVDRVGAGAAALAALHPLEFSPEAKWEVSAGVGNYKGANAVAIGAFYRPNGDTMFSIGTSLGGGENMVNAGVTLRVGDGETENYPARKVMAQQIKDLQSVVNTQNEKIEQLTQLVNTLVGANQQIQPVVSAPQAQADAEEAQQA